MKKRLLIILPVVLAAAAAVIAVVLLTAQPKSGETHDEGVSEKKSESSWSVKGDKNQHTAALYTFGKTAEKIREELPDEINLEHKHVDDIALYEMYTEANSKQKLLLFLHGQTSRKEEFLHEMLNYVEHGYYCVAIDLYGYGERTQSDALMSFSATERTSKDLDLLLDYYEATGQADSNNFAIIGLSQGGSVAYHYGAFGKRTPRAIVTGSTTPDFTRFKDNSCVQDGKPVDPVWSESEIDEFIKKNNPIDHIERFYKPAIMAGNSIDDPVVSYKGTESFEKQLNGKNKNLSFYYFDGLKHNVSESFMRNIPAFLNEHM